MSAVTVRVEDRDLKRAEALLADLPGGVDRAVRHALDRAGRVVRQESVAKIRERYAISAQDIRAEENIRSWIRGGGDAGREMTVHVSGHRIPLFRFQGASPSGPTPDKQRGKVPVMIGGQWRRVWPGVNAMGHQLQETAPKHIKGAFVAEMSNGHKGIFRRTGAATSKGNDEIQEVMGSSVATMLGSPGVAAAMRDAMSRAFLEGLERATRELLERGGKA